MGGLTDIISPYNPAGDPAFGSKLLAKASTAYPFIQQYHPNVMVSPSTQGDYAETWPADETGDAQYPRPKELPMGGVGVQVFKPDKFGPSDLAAEFLHVDPYANQMRAQLMHTLTPHQVAMLKHSSEDYSSTLERGEPEHRAMQNALDSALRGYTVGQWPAEANAAMRYSPDQLRLLDGLRHYMTTGQR